MEIINKEENIYYDEETEEVVIKLTKEEMLENARKIREEMFGSKE